MIHLLKGRYGRRGDVASEGQALVETALILTLMIFLSLATFDLGRGLAAHLALTEATQEGAVYAAHRRYSTAAPPNAPVTNAQIQTRVRTSSNAEAVMNANVTVTCASGRVTVASAYALPVVSPLAQFAFGSTFTLNVNSKANILRGTCL